MPNDDNFTFENGYFGYVSPVFVDIRSSSILFSDGDKVKVSKIIRSFTFEVIEILRDDKHLREIGIRGDCVCAICTTPQIGDVHRIADRTWHINTFMGMLNALLKQNNLPNISVGIGMSTAEELVVKAGRKGTGINNKVWIGKAVSLASNLSSLGNTNGICALVYSDCSYTNFINQLVEECGEKAKGWFTKIDNNRSVGTFYHANVTKTAFNDWVEAGMNN